MAGTQHTQSNQRSEMLSFPTSAELSHICDAARLPEHPDHQRACNALASHIWDVFMRAEDSLSMHTLIAVTHRFNNAEGGIDLG